MKKRFLSLALAAVMAVGMLPMTAVQNAAAATESEQKSAIDRSAYEGLGFTGLDAENDDNSFFGTANTVLMPKKELYLNYNGSSNYGQLLRSGLNMYNGGGGLRERGAYQRYGQYKNGDWANLKDENGYTGGQLGGTELYRDVTSKNSHKRRAYAESVAFNPGGGRDSNVATVYITTVDGNRSNQKISLEIASFTNEGKTRSTTTYTVTTCGAGSALNESGYFYTPDYTALIDITAGDYDGDGLDEIALYGADNRVVIYKYEGGRLRNWKTIGSSEIYTDTEVSKSGDGSATVKRAAVVTLESYDLDKNNTDELVITVSAPQGVSKTKYKEMNYGYIYGGKPFVQQSKIPLYDSSVVLHSANSAAGDFTGNGRNMLIFGGRAASTSNPTGININDKMAVRIVNYNHSTKSYEASDIQKYGEEFNSTMLVERGLKYNPPVGMTAFNMYGEKDSDGNSGERLFLFDRLYKYVGGTFQADGTTINYGSDQRNNANEKRNKDKTWILGITKGNFTKQDIGRKEQLIAVVGQKESGNDAYWFQIAYISADSNGNAVRNWEGVLNQATNYYNRTDKSREGAYLTVCAPDVDNDSMLLKFKGSETYYSKPEVQAIMQSAPYFRDVADVYDDYLNNGATTYGKSESDSKGVSASIEVSLGAYISAEASLGASAEMETSIAAVASYEHQSTWTTSTEVEYAGGIGDDYVVMYTVPFHRYVYDGILENGKTYPVIIEEPLTPSTVIVTVDKYDEIASMYEGLEPIRGNVLKSTPGDPQSYTTWGKGEFKRVGERQLLTNAGKGNGSTVTVSKSEEYEQSHNFSVGVEESLKAGGGAGFLGNNVKAGVVQSLTASVGGVFSKMNGVAYTGTVDNLPEGVTDFGFNWELGYSQIKFNDEDVIVIGYQTYNVKRPPAAPKNVAITDISRDTMTVEWDEAPEAAVYELSFITEDGEELPLANISGTAAQNGVVSHEIKNLNPSTSYAFSVRASDAYGVRSLASPQVTGRTLADGDEEFSITEQPKDTETAAGTDAVFTVRAVGTAAEPIQYQWYTYDSEDKQWNRIGSNSNELKIAATEDMDGSRYYCTVYQGMRVLKSKSVKLSIGLSSSSTALSITNGGKKVGNDDFVKADYEIVSQTQTTPKVWKQNSVTVDGKTYVKLAKNETESFDTEGNVSYTYSEPYVWMLTDGGTVKYFADKSGKPDTAAEYTVTSRLIFSNGETGIETAAKPETLAAAVTINGVESKEGYKLVSEDKYVYVCEVAETDSEGKPTGATVMKYYIANAEGTYDECTVDAQADYVTIDGTDYRMDSFAEVKTLQDGDEVTTETSEHKVGDVITLTAEVSESSRKAIKDGNLNFRITNKATGATETVKGTLDAAGKKWTAEYRFPNAGAYDVTAMYMGSNIFKSSVSDKITVNAYSPESKSLFISGGNLTYGSGLALKPIIIEKDKKTDAGDKVTYVIKKYVKDDKGVETLKECSTSMIVNDVFAADSTGKYEITASMTENGETVTAAATVSVLPKTVTVSANSATGNLGESEQTRRDRISVTVDGISQQDEDKLRSAITVKSAAFTAKTKGEYPIEVELGDVSELETRYLIVIEKGIYTLAEDTVTVGATAKANGTVLITYVTNKYNTDGTVAGKSTPLTVDSGSQIPKGADVTFSAQPAPGFGVDSWVVPEGMTNPGKNNTFTIENISQNATGIIISFAYSLNRVDFSAVDEDGYPVSAEVGAVVGAYADGRSFNSGDTLTAGKKITLTAKPGDGYVLSSWQKKNGGIWESIKAEGSERNDTGLVRTVSDVTTNEEYRAVFAAKQERTLAFAVTDEGSGSSVASAEVYVNGTKLTETAGGKFVYTAYKHEKLEIEVKTPDSVLIDYWTVGADTVAGSVSRYTVYDYDLADGTLCTVYCTIPNERQVSFGGYLTDGNRPSWAHEYISATRDGNKVMSSPSVQPQGVRIEFTAVPADGYRVKEWTLNGAVVGGTEEKYTLTVDGSADVRAIFEKKPVVTVSYDSAAGNVSADVNGNPMGAYVEFGSDVELTVTPKRGYTVKSAALNGTPLTLGVGTANTDIRFCTAENINADASIVVTFAKKPVVTVNAGSNGAVTVRGTSDFAEKEITSGGYVDFDTDMTAEIVPDFGYVIDSIKIDSAAVRFTTEENDDKVSLTLNSVNTDKSIEVTFRALEKYEVDFEVINTAAGAAGATHGTLTVTAARKGMDAYATEDVDTIGGTVTVYEGGTLVLNANADSDYRVREWTVDGTVDSDAGKTLTFTAAELAALSDRTVKVQFEEGKGRLTFVQPYGGVLTAAAAGTNFVSGGTPEIDAEVEFTLVPDEHYVLKCWLLNGVPIADEEELKYIFTADGADATVSAELEKEMLNITAAADENGFVSGLPSVVRHGDTVTLTAAAKAGYEFEGWYKDGTRIDGAQEVYTFTAETDAEFVAKFTEKEAKTVYSITILPTANGTIHATVDGINVTEAEEGTQVTFTAVADTNYMLSAWTNDAAAEKETGFTRTVTSNLTVGAEFIPALYYDVVYGVKEGTNGGTVSGKAGETAITADITVRHARGSKLVFTATPDSGKMVKKWTVNGADMNELSNTLELELTENTRVTVEFENLVLWKIADDAAGEYAIVDMVREPSDYGTDADRTVRDGGSAQFRIVPAESKTITSLVLADDTADTVEIVRNTADGSYDIKLTGIRKDVNLTVTTASGIPLTVEDAENGTVTVKNGDTVLASGSAVNAGDVLTITATPNSSYRTLAVKVNGNTIRNGEYTVTDADTAVIITATFTRSSGGGGGGGGGGSTAVTSFVIGFESNGGSKVESVKADRNTAISVPTAPTKDGFEFDGWYTDKELTEKYDFSEKVTKSFTLYAKWNERKSETPEWKNPFGDVKDGDWFRDAVEYVNKNGLMSGTDVTEFDPNGLVTRAMLVTVLWRAENKPQVNLIMPFADVEENAYYAGAVRWAASEGIVKGYSKVEFAPNDNITREQIAAIMHRYAAYKKYDTSAGENTNILSYADYAEISEYAIPSVQYAVGSGLIKGKTDSTINPSDNATRAETAEILKRFIEANK